MADLNECILCQSSFTSSDSYAVTKCGHIFHEPCIQKCIQASDNKCPNCAVKLTENDVVIMRKLQKVDPEIEPKCNELDEIIAKSELMFSNYEKIVDDMHSKYHHLENVVAKVDSKCTLLDEIIADNESKRRLLEGIVSQYHELQNIKAKMFDERESKRRHHLENRDPFTFPEKAGIMLGSGPLITCCVGFVCGIPSICVYLLTKL